MSFLRRVEERLPPGFRFHPRDEELVCEYLQKKIASSNNHINGSFHELVFQMLIDVDLNKCEPWDLPEMACVGGKEWYFFNLRDRKYSTGQRTNRATQSGYWKATGKDRLVTRKQILVGMRKTLVFYKGRAPKGKKTDWVMHEFRVEPNDDLSNFSTKEDWVLCRVYYKSRSTVPKNMAARTPAATPNFHDYGCSSSALPPLVHNYINFDHAPGEHEVPIFSNPLARPAAAVIHQLVPPPQPGAHLSSQLAADVGPDLISSLVNCERKTIKAVISCMSLRDGVTQSYLSPDTTPGLQNM